MRWVVLLLTLLGLSPYAWGAEITPPVGQQVYVLGEVHDNAAHHSEQARLVELIAPKAVVWEMLTPEQANVLAGLDLSDATAVEAALAWHESGWPDFSMYHPIFLAAGRATHVGAAVIRDDVKEAMMNGAQSMIGMELPRFTPDVQAALEAEQAEAHCNALPPDLLPGMVEAQRLRDAALAGAAYQAGVDFGTPVVIITGTGHARTDTGAPAHLRAMDPDVKVWSLGQLEHPQTEGPFDAVNVTPPTPREDPCLAFR